MNRRQWMKSAIAILATLPFYSYSQPTASPSTSPSPKRRHPRSNVSTKPSTENHSPLIIPLSPLPYDPDALEPFISKEIMDLHYGRHHAGYHRQFQDAITRLNLTTQHSVETILRNLDNFPEEIRSIFRNEGGGFYNHELFWRCMKRNGGGRPIDELGVTIIEAFGSYENFKQEFTNQSLSLFGSGWCWLSLTRDQKIAIQTTPNQDNPLMKGDTPIFGIDLWEHAYYLQYHNRKSEYIDSFFKIINWDFICDRYRKLTSTSTSKNISPNIEFTHSC